HRENSSVSRSCGQLVTTCYCEPCDFLVPGRTDFSSETKAPIPVNASHRQFPDVPGQSRHPLLLSSDAECVNVTKTPAKPPGANISNLKRLACSAYTLAYFAYRKTRRAS